MAEYLDLYDIDLYINGKITEIEPTNFSFSITDSIYKLYTEAILTLSDTSGIIQNSLVDVEGMPITINFGDKPREISLKCPFSIEGSKLEKVTSPGFLNGDLDIRLIHEWYNKQDIKSRAFNDRISNIISLFAQEYGGFLNTDIKGSSNQDIWYKLLITEGKFINDILLPNAYSKDKNKSPFYCYITCDNVLHFKTYDHMMEGNPLENITIEVSTDKMATQESIIDIRRYRDGSELHKHLRHRLLHKIDRKNGDIVEEEDYMNEYPMSTNEQMPVIVDDRLITSSHFLGYNWSEVGRQENLLGQLNYSMRDSMFADRLICMMPFNPKLTSGNKVNLKTFTFNKEGGLEDSNEPFCGDYIIENSTHTWSHKDQRGFTRLNLGKKRVKLSNEYTIKQRLF